MSGSHKPDSAHGTPSLDPQGPATEDVEIGDPALGIDEDTRLGPECKNSYYIQIDTEGNRTEIDNRYEVTIHDVVREKLRNAEIIRRHWEGNGWAASMRRKRERRRAEADADQSSNANAGLPSPNSHPVKKDQT